MKGGHKKKGASSTEKKDRERKDDSTSNEKKNQERKDDATSTKTKDWDRNVDWLELLQDGLKEYEESKAAKKPKNAMEVMRRVRSELKELKPKHYAAREFSFGLFDRIPLDAQENIGNKCKFAMISAVHKIMGLEARLEEEGGWRKFCTAFCKKVVPKPKAMEDLYAGLYEEQGRCEPLAPDYIQSLLTLDAVFLACFLGSCYHQPFADRFPSFGSAIHRTTARTVEGILNPLMKDLFKVENQIPLVLIHRVLLLLEEKAGTPNPSKEADATLSRICGCAVYHLSCLLPGRDDAISNRLSDNVGDPVVRFSRDIKFKDCSNFLNCVYRVLCQGLESVSKIPANEDGPQLIQPQKVYWSTQQRLSVILPKATELHKAGIKFRGRKGLFHNIEFKRGWLKANLHLPKLTIDEDTEVLWRNLVAYEDILHHAGVEEDYYNHDFTNYLNFMDKLIDDASDVAELKSGSRPVIMAHRLGDDEALASFFNNKITRRCIVDRAPDDKWGLLQREIYCFYKEKQRRWCVEFVRENCINPWVAISFLVATLLLIMTFIQTYLTLLDYYNLDYNKGGYLGGYYLTH